MSLIMARQCGHLWGAMRITRIKAEVAVEGNERLPDTIRAELAEATLREIAAWAGEALAQVEAMEAGE